eukprot:TRINITY_DN22932_c0_g1_i1.p1 TRINITY_DN22932_c0_g1~~TRINITY_DN22932_c0_g1_i1.p1  ORF type:complete len:577 (-),score=62.13 TRINITY_DN22932_c0_g1_i1:92-1822(-)
MSPNGGRYSKLIYAGHNLRDQDVTSLKLDPHDCYYHEVDFSCNDLSSKGLQTVLDFCHHCKELRVLKLFKNKIDDWAAEGLADLCKALPNLEEIHLSHNHFTGGGVETIVKMACRTRGDRDVPLWLRMEQNDVENADDFVRNLMKKFSVCDRRDEKICTNRFCSYNRRVHVPHIWKQRNSGSWSNNKAGSQRPKSPDWYSNRNSKLTLTARDSGEDQNWRWEKRGSGYDSYSHGYDNGYNGYNGYNGSMHSDRYDRGNWEHDNRHQDHRSDDRDWRSTSKRGDWSHRESGGGGYGYGSSTRRETWRSKSRSLSYRIQRRPSKRYGQDEVEKGERDNGSDRRSRRTEEPHSSSHRRLRSSNDDDEKDDDKRMKLKRRRRLEPVEPEKSEPSAPSRRRLAPRDSEAAESPQRSPSPMMAQPVGIDDSLNVADNSESYSEYSDGEDGQAGEDQKPKGNSQGSQATSSNGARTGQPAASSSSQATAGSQAASKRAEKKQQESNPPPGVAAMVGLSSSSEDELSDDEDSRWNEDRGCSPPQRSRSASPVPAGTRIGSSSSGALKDRLATLKQDLKQKLPAR